MNIIAMLCVQNYWIYIKCIYQHNFRILRIYNLEWNYFSMIITFLSNQWQSNIFSQFYVKVYGTDNHADAVWRRKGAVIIYRKGEGGVECLQRSNLEILTPLKLTHAKRVHNATPPKLQTCKMWPLHFLTFLTIIYTRNMI